jgi:hypothetical protein
MFSAPLLRHSLALAILLFPASRLYAVDQELEINPKGREVIASVSDANVKRVIFTTRITGKTSRYLDFAARGPSGIKGFVEVRQIARGARPGPVFRLQFPRARRGFTTELTDGSSSARALAANTAPSTPDPTPEQIKQVMDATGLSEPVTRILLKYMTVAEIIAKYGRPAPGTPPSGSGPTTPSPTNPTPQTPPGSLAGRALLSQDACSPSVEEYQVRFVIDLEGINRSTAGTPFTVAAQITEGESELLAASIKPFSDGKFAPKPLVLIESVGFSYYASSGQSLRLVRWARGRPGKPRVIKIENSLFHQGQVLLRAVAEGLLTGGRGSFEVINGERAGGACLNLVRARQCVNGYKGGDCR